jgi:arylsulfatase
MLRFLLGLSLISCLLVSCGGERTDRERIEGLVFASPLEFTPKEHAVSPPAPLETALDPTAILLVTLDTTRADHLSVYGYDKITSPALDRIAAEGVRAAHAISPMPTTDPAHLSILTGQFPRSHGVIKNGIELKDGTPSLAAWAKSRGYRTAAFVSRAHTNPKALNLAGFDDESGPSGDEKARDGRLTLEDALDWLDDHGNEPFFLWVHFFDPHGPYRPTRELADKWIPKELQLENPEPSKHGRIYTERQVQAKIARYDAEVNYMDGLVDELVTHVRGLRVKQQPPLVVVAGDHGEAMDELLDSHGFAFDHGKHLYRGITHVPLFFVWPGRIPAGKVIEGPVQTTDIAATVFDLIGDNGFATQGESLVPLFSGAEPSKRLAFTERRLLSERKRKELKLKGVRQYAVQDHRYMLIVSQPDGVDQLIDLQGDPASLTDVSSEQPEVRDRLDHALRDWLDRVSAAEGVTLEIREEKLEALRALGYVQ